MKPIELGGELGSQRAGGSSSGSKARKDAGLPRKPGQAKLLSGRGWLAGGTQIALPPAGAPRGKPRGQWGGAGARARRGQP